MNQINKFFTWVWILYIPTCILFYNRLPEVTDEVMTLILVYFALQKWNRARECKRIKDEYKAYLGIMLVFFLYSLVIKSNVFPGIIQDLIQQLRPYLVFYSTYLLAPKLNEKQLNKITKVGVYGLIIFVGLNGAGYKTSYTGVETPIVAQASLLCGLLYYMNHNVASKKATRITILILSIGLISGKSKFFGEYVVALYVIFFLKKKLELNSLRTNAILVLLVTFSIIVSWEKFEAYYISGFEEEYMSEMEARPAYYKTAVSIIFKDYFPLGSGLASFATATCAKFYSPLYYKYGLNEIWGLQPTQPWFIADAFYPTLAQFGFVGVCLFLTFWYRRYKEIYRISELKYYKIALLCMFAIFVEATADTSYLSGKGMGYFMLMAMCMRQELYYKDNQRRIMAMEAEQQALAEAEAQAETKAQEKEQIVEELSASEA